ncbi:MAG: acetyl-CoA carboxylase biotin carboxyl carrier protein subunit [Bacteroidetes bacterium]|nr:acetyl-CoA carboxylase biotin carboxyl carrier protein subunit [Bacteroidota bacterium]MBU1719811.1 acetyl-CoA carboxylase biotin carboxyl carrier protein subunit [Bacteroidota bacterium]
MKLELNIDNNHTCQVDMLTRDENLITFQVDDTTYETDIVRVSEGVYSIVIGSKSYNVEIFRGENKKKYEVQTYQHTYEVDIIDAEAKYLLNRPKGHDNESGVVISTPMPGKVVKILVNAGDSVVEGQTVIIVEAMKMQSEYKVKKDRIIKEIKVKEGDTVTANQPLIIVE